MHQIGKCNFESNCSHAALMENQVANLQAKGINANFLSSTKSGQERSAIMEDIKSNAPSIRLLFITPESLSTEGFLSTLKLMKTKSTLTLFAVDEAHCISSWCVQRETGSLGYAITMMWICMF